jgi:hypothetical protein
LSSRSSQPACVIDQRKSRSLGRCGAITPSLHRARNKVLWYLYEEGGIASTRAANRASIAQASSLEPGDFQAL